MTGLPLRDIAEIIGRRLNVPIVSKSTDHFGFLKPFVSIDSPASSKLTQENLGWRPAQPSLFTDLERGITLISREKPEFDIKKVSSGVFTCGTTDETTIQ